MNFTRSLQYGVTALGLSASMCFADAAEQATLNGHLSAGVEHDSNVSVDDLNASSEQSDQAWVFDAGLEGVLKPAERLNLTLGYSLSGSRYRELDQFDQDIHLLSADLSYDFDPVTIGTSYHYSHSVLGSEPFLDFHRASAYLGSLIGDDVYLLASLQEKRKDYEESEATTRRMPKRNPSTMTSGECVRRCSTAFCWEERIIGSVLAGDMKHGNTTNRWFPRLTRSSTILSPGILSIRPPVVGPSGPMFSRPVGESV